MPVEHGERIASLETEMETVKAQNVAILGKLDAIQSEMSRYKGFLGGVAFLVSGAMVVLTFLKGWLFAK